MKPLVSVIIPVYERPKVIKRALNSLLNQTFKNFEVIVSEDGSNNDCLKIIKYFTAEGLRIKYIYSTHSGPAEMMNTGVKMSSGRFITFLDSDDEYMAAHIKLRVNYFSKTKVDLIYSPAKLVGNTRDMFVPDAKNKNKKIHIDDCYIGGTFFGKKEVFENIKFRKVYSHDSRFIKDCLNKGYIINLFDVRTYVYYRNSADSILTNLNKKK